jgi:hypothetical protein
MPVHVKCQNLESQQSKSQYQHQSLPRAFVPLDLQPDPEGDLIRCAEMHRILTDERPAWWRTTPSWLRSSVSAF